MAEHFDVVVVGARCAGSPLAAQLARNGLRVCVLDRARFPSEVPSTHLIHPWGVAFLERLGMHDRLLATDAPPLEQGAFVVDDVRLELNPGLAQRFEAPWLCIRRAVLDPLLIGLAEESGAEVRTETSAVGLLEHEGVVRGVRTRAGTLKASLVVGADGPNSAVARYVGAREYNVSEPGRLFLWAYFEGADAPEGYGCLGRIGELGFLSMHTDNGLFLAGVAPSMALRDKYMADVSKGLSEGIARIEEVADLLSRATRIGPVRTMARWHGYFREATGPGWVLVGDAGHFKDPTPAQGISDALRQGEHLAPAITAALEDGNMDERLTAWWRWRDEDAWEMYWFANDMGSAEPSPGIVTEVIRGLSRKPDGAEQLGRVLNHELAPSKLFNASRGLRALLRAAASSPGRLPLLVSETRTLREVESQRRKLERGPEFFSTKTETGQLHRSLADRRG